MARFNLFISNTANIVIFLKIPKKSNKNHNKTTKIDDFVSVC